MKIITSHERTDMDALASIYAASLLYPDHRPLLPQKLNRNLRDFLALYKDELPFVERRELPRHRISHLLLVDTQAIAPLPGMDSHTLIQIIDHHVLEGPLAEGSKAASASVTFEGEAVGATTTLLIEEIRRRRMAIDRLGATLLLMGIYEDTGSLSYLTTTARDVQAAAWALEQGADLSLADDFLHSPLSNGQREALSRLTAGSTLHTIHGRSICIAEILLEDYVDELSTLAHQLLDMYEPEACFILAQHQRKVQIIARSATNAIDVAALLRTFGGGGHSKASAALVRETTLAQVRARLLAALEEQVEPPVLVREIMSTNVHTLKLDMSVQEAARLMRRYGHEGFPVVDGERLVGILTRRDIDRALHHGLDDTPVRRFLHTGPFHVLPDDPVDQVQREMIEYDLGQVPVVEDGRFVGIVTRTDLIKLWALVPSQSRAREIRQSLEEALPKPLLELLLSARDVANDLGYSLYIVGGFVRDLLLGAPNLDLDLVVEGDAIRLAHRLADQLADQIGRRVRSHSRFGTAKVIFEGERPAGVPPTLDFVTARTEFYERPTVLPQVESSSIKQDLYRRDFTINTMAICLDRDRFGELLDYYGGERDLHEGRIRVLHSLSFVEDPTRILRAVRFEQRLGFIIEPRTEELIDEALDLLSHVTGERLRHELYLLLSEAEPEHSLERLNRLGALSQVHPQLRFSSDMSELFARLRERFHAWPERSRRAWPAGQRGETPSDGPDDEEANAPALCLCYLALLTSSMSRDELESFVAHLHISQSDASLLRQVASLRESLNLLKAQAMLRSTIHRLLHPFSREARFVLSVLTSSPLVGERLDLYEQELSRVAPRIDGHYLKSLGLPPGPVYGEILARVQKALLDQEIATVEDERALAQRLVEASHGG